MRVPCCNSYAVRNRKEDIIMKVLIVGSGGREHAIAASVAKSSHVDKIYCAPGNAGIGQIAELVPIGAMEFDRLADFAKENQIDLTIIGMDDPLVGGIVDVFEKEGLRVFGPQHMRHLMIRKKHWLIWRRRLCRSF